MADISNLIYATIVGVIVSNITQIISKLLELIFSNFSLGFLSRIFRREKERSEIDVVRSKVTTYMGTSFSESVGYDAIIHKLNQQKINVRSIRELSSVDTFNRVKSDNCEITFPGKVIINKDLYIIASSADKNIGKMGTILSDMMLKLCSDTLSVYEIKKILDTWKNEYLDYKKQYVNENNISYFSLDIETVNDKENNINQTKMQWNGYLIKTFKTFDNIFFKDKDILLKKLDFFTNNETYYQKYGIPYNLGFLFHGKPGCGKTSCIKAIANYTKRHIVEINLKSIKTCKEFVHIFTSGFINDKYIPFDKRIIIIEDIDCMADIVQDRQKNNDNAKSNLKKQILKELKEENSDDKLTLSCILNTIDGVLEQYGRILIITTNYPDKLDRALIRPGRIDMKIHFTLCDNKMTRDIVEFFCDTKLDNGITFKEYVYSPAELIDQCLFHRDNPGKLIKKLI